MMILKDIESHLNLSFSLNIDAFNYMVFASLENMRYFGCGAVGHQVCSCPEKCGVQSGPSRLWLLLQVRFRGLLVALAEGLLPTAESLSVAGAPIVVENSIAEEYPDALFNPSVD